MSASGCSAPAGSPKKSPTSTPSASPIRIRVEGPAACPREAGSRRCGGPSTSLTASGLLVGGRGDAGTRGRSRRRSEPDEHHRHVHPREVGHAEHEHRRPDVDGRSGDHVARTHDEAVDHLLRLELLLPRRRQEQHVPHGIHQRVVDRVLRGLDPAQRSPARGSARRSRSCPARPPAARRSPPAGPRYLITRDTTKSCSTIPAMFTTWK